MEQNVFFLMLLVHRYECTIFSKMLVGLQIGTCNHL